MKIEEFRVGNYVRAKSPERQIFEEPVILNTGYFAHLINRTIDVEPIPITREWLEKFGFKTHDNWQHTWLHKDNLYINYHHREYLLKGIGRNKEIEYVHTLQNLWFALTGEELTINNQ